MSIYSSDINLNLPISPDDAVEPKVALAIAPMHYAMHAFHKSVSEVTGAWQPAEAEWASIMPQVMLRAGQRRRHYLVAAVNIAVGQTFYIDGAGQAQLASAAAAGTLAIGFALKAVLAGAVGEFILFEGLVNVTGAVAGTKYYQANAAGTIAAAPGTVPQPVGIGIKTDYIYMRIAL